MAPRSLRVVHMVSSLQGGGMEHFVLRLADAQRRRGHDASAIAFQGGPLAEHAARLGVPVTILGGRRTAPRVLKGALATALARPHILHAHNPSALHYAAVGKAVSGARLVLTDHAQTRGIIRVPRDVEWRLTDAVVAVSHDTAKKSGAVGRVPELTVFHNGVDSVTPKRSRAEVRAELGLGDGPVALNLAGFVPVKAHEVLVRAAAHLRDRGARLTILLAGDGPERPRVEALAKELALGPDHLRFLGFRADAPDLLGAADVFVLASRNEGLPLAVLEAMSLRLPVVVTPVGGNPEIVGDGEHGFHVPVDDDRALADALGRLATDAELRARLGEAGQRRVRDELSFERMTDKYEDLYRRLLARPARLGLGS